MQHEDAYQPIACDFYDRLEAFATLRRRVRLSLRPTLRDGNVEVQSAEGLIADIYTREDKREVLRLDNGLEIRLDRIIDIGTVG